MSDRLIGDSGVVRFEPAHVPEHSIDLDEFCCSYRRRGYIEDADAVFAVGKKDVLQVAAGLSDDYYWLSVKEARVAVERR